MTAARRAMPTPPTPFQRLRVRLTSAARHDRLASALEDQAARLRARARRSDQIGQHYVAHAQRVAALELDQIRENHT